MTTNERRQNHKRIDRAIRDHRRETVAALVIRHLTQREITEALRKQGLRNPLTGEAWGLTCVHDDIKALEADWQRRYRATIDEHKARQLADIGEVLRQGWLNKDLSVVLAALAQKATLLGLNKPSQVDITVYVRERAEALGLDPDEAVREAERIVRATR